MVDGAVFSSGESALKLHNQWPLRWAKLNREAFEEYGKMGEAVFWMRAGYAGIYLMFTDIHYPHSLLEMYACFRQYVVC